MKHIHSWGIVGLLAAMAWTTGCGAGPAQTKTVRVSAETARVLNRVGKDLRQAKAGLRVSCWEQHLIEAPPHCEFKLDTRGEPELAVQMIPHPFNGKPMVLRVTGGSDLLRKALHEALGSVSPTRDFRYSPDSDPLDERVLELENGALRIRCVATRTEPAQHDCWTLIGAELLQ